MSDTLNLTVVLPVTPDEIYVAWLNSECHATITGEPANISPEVGSRFTAGDGYITGEILDLVPVERIIMSWRTVAFPEDAPDSRLEIHLEPVDDSTRVFFNHTDIPAGQGPGYEQGWKEHYIEPMKIYFAD